MDKKIGMIGKICPLSRCSRSKKASTAVALAFFSRAAVFRIGVHFPLARGGAGQPAAVWHKLKTWFPIDLAKIISPETAGTKGSCPFIDGAFDPTRIEPVFVPKWEHTEKGGALLRENRRT
jgi:hypothetical protein